MKLQFVFALLFSLSAFGAVPVPRNIPSYDSVADLVAAQTVRVYPMVHVKGYYAPGDGGGGFFKAINSVTSTNLGGRIFSGVADWSWDAQFDREISVKRFGAVGNGSADDTAAIQSAIDAAGAGEVYFPVGAYKTTAPLIVDTIGLVIRGQGGRSGATKIVAYHTDGPVLRIKKRSVKLDSFLIDSGEPRLSAVYDNVNFGIHQEGPDEPNASISAQIWNDIYVQNQPSHGFMMVGLNQHSSFNELYATSCKGHGFFMNGGETTGRVNYSTPGLIEGMDGLSALNCGGHGLAIGNFTGHQSYPYRINIKNYEGVNNATDPAVRFANFDSYVFGANISIHLSAFGASPTDASKGGLYVNGESIEALNIRSIGLDGDAVYMSGVGAPGFISTTGNLVGGVRVISGTASAGVRLADGVRNSRVIIPVIANMTIPVINEDTSRADGNYIEVFPNWLTPATLASGVTTNYSIPLGYKTIRLAGNADGTSALSGIEKPNSGRRLRLVNVGSYSVTLMHNSGTSTLGQRFLTPTAASVVLAPGDTCDVEYDAPNTTAWRVVNLSSPAPSNTLHFGENLSKIKSTQDGVITLFNNAEDGFTSLRFGGSSSLFTAFIPSGTTMRTMLADGSGHARHDALSFGLSSSLKIGPDGDVYFRAAGADTRKGAGSKILFSNNNDPITGGALDDAGLERGAVGTLRVNNGSTGGGSLQVDGLTLNPLAYDPTTWNGSTNVPTRDDVRDAIYGLGPLARSAETNVTVTGGVYVDHVQTTNGVTDQTLTANVLVTADSNKKLAAATLANQRLYGRNTAGTGAPEEVTISQVLDWYSPKNFVRSFDDFISGTSAGDGNWASTANGGALSFGAGEQGRPGLLVLSTSTSATGAPVVFKSLTAVRFGGGTWGFEIALKLSALSDGTETYSVLAGWHDAASVVDGVWFQYTDSVNGGEWEGKTSSNSSPSTLDTNVAATTSWTTLRAEVNAAGTSVEYFIDGVSVGTLSATIPTGASRETGPAFRIVKSAGLTARTMSVDYTIEEFIPTTPR